MKSITQVTMSALIVAATGIWAGCSTADEVVAADDADVTAGNCEVMDFRNGEASKETMGPAEIAKLRDPVARKVLAGNGCPTNFLEISQKLKKTDGEGCAPGEGEVLPNDFEQPCTFGNGFYCGDNGIRGGKKTLYNCFEGTVAPVGVCKEECVAGPPGQDDECRGGMSPPGGGPSTRFVSETSQVLDRPDQYRAVMTRRCSGREEHALLMSTFGIDANMQRLPEEVELIGQDETTGVFNYYARERGEWRFFGSSEDFITRGYDCKNGACQAKARQQTRCAGCHTGGGLVMKELASPWVHWETAGGFGIPGGGTKTPGVDGLMSRFKDDLGRRGNGVDLEPTVVGGNSGKYLRRRIEILKSKGTAELLRPLFCTMDVNLDSGDRSGPTFVSPTFFVDPMWPGFQGLEFNPQDYKALVAANGQRITSDAAGKQQLVGKNGPVTDTFFSFTYPSRSSGGIDTMYVRMLLGDKIIDEDFAMDVLHVDFTRSIFSDTRCELLDAAPNLEAGKMNPNAIREGFKAGLAGKPGAAAQLLASLNDPNDVEANQVDVTKFLEACNARPKKELLADMMTYASQMRNRFRELDIAEFPATVPFDNIPDGRKTFDPVTCVLK